MTIDLSKFYLIPKRKFAEGLFSAGMLLAFLTSLRPWFLWSIHSFFPLIVSMMLGIAMLVDRTTRKSLFTKTNFLAPCIIYLLLTVYQSIRSGNNIVGLVMPVFYTYIFFMLYRYDKSRLLRLSTFIAKSVAIILVPSLFFFILFLLGFPLPSRDLVFGDYFYSFTNYYFFLLDDRQLFAFIPRFQSVFPEPTYLGSTCAVLLLSQRGRWKRWYNIVLLTALLISFSLGAYVYITAIIFLNLWVKGRKILVNLIITISFIGAFVASSFFYNGGDNLVHDLILLRLEIDDGELAGNNRTTESFDVDFDNYIQSSDILFGRNRVAEFGDSGYKVFIYDYGLVGLALLILFYYLSFSPSDKRRSKISAWFVAAMIFGVDAFVLWLGRFIPLYCAAFTGVEDESEESNELETIPHEHTT